MSNEDIPVELASIIDALNEVSYKFGVLDEELLMLEEESVIQTPKVRDRINLIYEEFRFLSRKRKALDGDRRLISEALSAKLNSERHDQTILDVEVKSRKQARKMDTFARTRILDATLRNEWNISCFKELEKIIALSIECRNFEIASLALGKIYTLRKARSIVEKCPIDCVIPESLPIAFIDTCSWDKEALLLVEKRESKSNRLWAEFINLKTKLGLE